MNRKNHLQKSLLAAVCIIFFAVITNTGCYYDKEEILYPSTGCDTAIVTYSGSVAPILSASCINGCHSGGAPSGGISLAAYADVKAQVNNGKLWGAVSYATGYSPMPKNSSRLSNCSLTKIKKWIDAGAPNN
jgi:hypothetical protein